MSRTAWVPGMPSPNPSGKTTIIPVEVRDYARRFTLPAIRELARIMQSAKKDADRIKAATAILDRGWGKPVQSVDFQGDSGQDALLRQIADAHLQAVVIAGNSPMTQLTSRTEETFAPNEPDSVEVARTRKRVV